MEESKNDATAAVDDEISEDRAEDGDGKGNSKEEAHWNLDACNLIVPEIINDTIEDDDNDNADDTGTHGNYLCCLTNTDSSIMTHENCFINLINAVVIVLVNFSIHNYNSILSNFPEIQIILENFSFTK